MKYMLLIYANEAHWPTMSQEQMGQAMAAYGAYTDAIAAAAPFSRSSRAAVRPSRSESCSLPVSVCVRVSPGLFRVSEPFCLSPTQATLTRPAGPCSGIREGPGPIRVTVSTGADRNPPGHDSDGRLRRGQTSPGLARVCRLRARADYLPASES